MSEPAREKRVARPLQRSCDCSGRCDDCAKKKQELQRKVASPSATRGLSQPGEVVHDVLRQPGLPLDEATRKQMELRLGHDFGRVRIHADARAAESARSVNAIAYTVGRHVVFDTNHFAPRSDEGRQLLAHELTHVLQQRNLVDHPSAPIEVSDPASAHEHEAHARAESAGRGAMTPLARPLLQRQPPPAQAVTPPSPDTICFSGVAPALPGGCAAASPADCLTYEQWLMSFRGMTTIAGTGGVLGGTRADETAPPTLPDPHPETRSVPAVRPRLTDHFIHHPTQTWVNNCLPPNLRDTAYALPSDCADIALILRHVWLSAHHRTETHGAYTLGDAAGGAGQRRIDRAITDVGAAGLPSMITPYANARDGRIRSFTQLAPMLHPGDVLVWVHDVGDIYHSNTISEIRRSSATGPITAIALLEGDQPLGLADVATVQAATPHGQTPPSVSDVRNAPARRIQLDVISNPADDPARAVWRWQDKTLLAAGPMTSVARPTRRAGHDRAASDWNALFSTASAERLPIIFEAALTDIRSVIERGAAGVAAEIDTLAHAAGQRLWALAHPPAGSGQRPDSARAGDLAETSHFRPLQAMEALIGAFAAPATGVVPAAATLWTRLLEEFRLAARGATSINFGRSVRRGTRVIRILVTGFDPFKGDDVPVPAGMNNPSGALALALDGQTFNAGSGVVAAVEAVILPVSFAQFAGSTGHAGIVERVVSPLIASRGVDAVLTTSLDESIGVGGAPRLERFVVGVHSQTDPVSRTPPEQGATANPRDIITEAVEVGAVAGAANTAAGPGTFTVGNALQLTLQDPARAAALQAAAPIAGCEDAAACAGHTTPPNVCICNPDRIRDIISTMTPGPTPTSIGFQLAGQPYQAEIVQGPGGNFLSNEVSYRTLRMLNTAGRSDVTSFHTHLPPVAPGNTVPPGNAAALHGALAERDRLVSAMRALIVTVAARIAARP